MSTDGERGGARALLVFVLLGGAALILWILRQPSTGSEQPGVDMVLGASVEEASPADLRAALDQTSRAKAKPEQQNPDAVEAKPRTASRETAIIVELEEPTPFKVAGKIVLNQQFCANLEVKLVRLADDESLTGPAGRGTERKVVDHASTRLDGGFRFSSVLPGDYLLLVEDPRASAFPERRGSELEYAFSALQETDLGNLLCHERTLTRYDGPIIEFDRALVHVTILKDGEPAPRMHVAAHDLGSGLRVQAERLPAPGEFQFSWQADYGEARIVVEDGRGQTLGANTQPASFIAGQLNELKVEIGTGALAANLPADFVFEPGVTVQVFIESPELPAGISYNESLASSSPVRVEALDEELDVHFPVLLPGTYHARAIAMKKVEGVGWRTIGELGTAPVVIRAGVTSRVEF